MSKQPTEVLYVWPAAARFGRRVPKERFYENTTMPAAVKDHFVSDIQRITWAFKLAEATINLPDSEAVPEIQVFQIDAKGDNVPDSVLAAMDKAIKTPIIFEITRTTPGRLSSGVAASVETTREIRMVTAPKHAGGKADVYYSTPWLPAETPRTPLPTAITLESLYSALLAPLLPVEAREGEDLASTQTRVQAIRRAEREVAALERKLRTEPQLNRKMELRRTLQAKKTQLEQLR